jgi:hypothetical protein
MRIPLTQLYPSASFRAAPTRSMRLLLAALLVCAVVALAASGAIFGAAVVCGLVMLAWIAVLIWLRPQWAAYLLAVGYPLTAGMSRLSHNVNLRPNELLLLVLLVLLVVRFLALRLPLPRLTWFDAAAAALILGGSLIPLLTLYGRHQSLTTDAAIVLLGPFKNYAVFWTVRLALTQTDHVRRTIATMLVTSGIVALIGVAQALQIGPVVQSLATYYPTKQVLGADLVGRITSVVGGWNDFAAYLCFVVLVGIAVAMTRARMLPPLLFNGLIVLDVTTLLVTGSIASILGLVAGVLILSVLFGESAWIRRLLVLAAFSGVLAALAFAPLLAIRLSHQYGGGNHGIIPQSLVYRFYLWQTYFLPDIAQHPLFGVSLTIPSSIPWPTEDSGYLYLLFRGGAIYVLCYAAFTWCCIRGAYLRLRSYRPRLRAAQAPPTRAKRRLPLAASIALPAATAAASFSMVLILLAMNISEAYFTYTAAASILWMTLAMTVHQAAPQPAIAEQRPSRRGSEQLATGFRLLHEKGTTDDAISTP